MGMPATGKQATVTGITIDRIVDGRIAESWTNWDTLGMLQQLGVVPALATRLTAKSAEGSPCAAPPAPGRICR